MSRLVKWILFCIQTRTTIRHSRISVVHIRVHPLLGILTHLVGKLSVSPHLGMIGIWNGISNLLGRIKPSGKGDITKVLRTPKSISALRLSLTRLIITTPLGGSNGKDITSSNIGLLVGYIRNEWPHIEGLLVLLLRDLSKVCGWIERGITAPHLLDIGQGLYWS